jgi:hypothetical protein
VKHIHTYTTSRIMMEEQAVNKRRNTRKRSWTSPVLNGALDDDVDTWKRLCSILRHEPHSSSVADGDYKPRSSEAMDEVVQRATNMDPGAVIAAELALSDALEKQRFTPRLVESVHAVLCWMISTSVGRRSAEPQLHNGREDSAWACSFIDRANSAFAQIEGPCMKSV